MKGAIHMRKLPILVAGVLAATLAGPIAAQAGSNPPDLVSYLNRTPTVTGSVTAADEHSVTLTTDSGNPMKLVIDSRSVVPAELPAGLRVRVQFNALGADAFHAQRITPLTAHEIRELDEQNQPRVRASMESGQGTAGTSEGAVAESRPSTSSHAAHSQGEYGRSSAQQSDTDARASQTSSEVTPSGKQRATEGQSAGQEGEAGQLPRASSSLPLIGALGLLALVAGVGFGLMRRRRA
jgi:thiol:disulfide interchange protein